MAQLDVWSCFLPADNKCCTPLVYSNASTSLKNPLLVRVWPMRLSVKLHLCRLLYMQYKITWLVRIRLCRLVGIRLNRWGLVLTSEWILSTKPYCLWQVFIIHLVNFAKPAWCIKDCCYLLVNYFIAIIFCCIFFPGHQYRFCQSSRCDSLFWVLVFSH